MTEKTSEMSLRHACDIYGRKQVEEWMGVKHSRVSQMLGEKPSIRLIFDEQGNYKRWSTTTFKGMEI